MEVEKFLVLAKNQHSFEMWCRTRNVCPKSVFYPINANSLRGKDFQAYQLVTLSDWESNQNYDQEFKDILRQQGMNL